MPYGTVSAETREYIMMRAAQSNVTDRIHLEESPGGDNPMREISIIVDGALDEEFSVFGLYEVSIADWIAELLQSTLDDSWWEVIVSAPAYDTWETVYRVSSED